MELTGTIIRIKEIEHISSKAKDGKDFQKREFWIQIPSAQYLVQEVYFKNNSKHLTETPLF